VLHLARQYQKPDYIIHFCLINLAGQRSWTELITNATLSFYYITQGLTQVGRKLCWIECLTSNNLRDFQVGWFFFTLTLWGLSRNDVMRSDHAGVIIDLWGLRQMGYWYSVAPYSILCADKYCCLAVFWLKAAIMFFTCFLNCRSTNLRYYFWFVLALSCWM